MVHEIFNRADRLFIVAYFLIAEEKSELASVLELLNF
jgi:hypothetical protein